MTGKAKRSAVLYGEFGCGNYGNEASLDSVLVWLRTRPEIELRSITREPATVTREHGLPSKSMYSDRRRLDWIPIKMRKALFKISDLVRMLKLVDRSDTVIVPGTGVFEQQMGGPPWGLTLNMYGLALATRIRGAQLALIGVGASYDSRPTVRWLTRRILRHAKFVSVRDGYSKGGLAAVGVHAQNVAVFPDVAFAL